MRATVEERFFAKVRETSAGCWKWTGWRNHWGYGQFRERDRSAHMAHRWAYEFLVAPVPDGLVLDHLCRDRACVNPWHLDPVTQRENLRRSDEVTGKRSAKTHCPRGHAYDERNTLRSRGRRRCRTCERAAYHAKKRANQ